MLPRRSPSVLPTCPAWLATRRRGRLAGPLNLIQDYGVGKRLNRARFPARSSACSGPSTSTRSRPPFQTRPTWRAPCPRCLFFEDHVAAATSTARPAPRTTGWHLCLVVATGHGSSKIAGSLSTCGAYGCPGYRHRLRARLSVHCLRRGSNSSFRLVA